MKKIEHKPYISAFHQFREELKKAILNEEIPMEFKRIDMLPYIGDIYIELDGIELNFAVAETFISSINPIIQSLFDSNRNPEEFQRLVELTKSKVPQLSDKDKKRIKHLEKRIEKIKRL